jgi:predicted CoA-binding protein
MSELCESPLQNPGNDEVRAILSSYRTVAVVGLSDKPHRDSHRVATYLQRAGYRVIPVNPMVTEVLGEKAYPSLRDVPEAIEIVDVFRRAEAVPAIVDDAIAVGAKVVWMQDGIVHNEAAGKARAAGLQVVMNKCMLREHARMGGRSH